MSRFLWFTVYSIIDCDIVDWRLAAKHRAVANV